MTSVSKISKLVTSKIILSSLNNFHTLEVVNCASETMEQCVAIVIDDVFQVSHVMVEINVEAVDTVA